MRWSSAKGIGRVSDRLPLAFADLVVETVMELCSPTEEEPAWHGSCLALAELARRGLLLPTRLHNALPAVLEALRYDVKQVQKSFFFFVLGAIFCSHQLVDDSLHSHLRASCSPHSLTLNHKCAHAARRCTTAAATQGARAVGSQVRDAACYVLWACARAYAPSVLKESTAMVAAALLVCLYLYLSIHSSTDQDNYLRICLSACISVDLSIYLFYLFLCRYQSI